MQEELTPRLCRLKSDLVAKIPCETETLRRELASQPLPYLLIHYMTWVDRLIPPRPRRVSVGKAFWQACLETANMEALTTIADAFSGGRDLTRHLSGAAFIRGYSNGRRGGKQWVVRDGGHKDFALNVYDLHHLHLTPSNPQGKRSGKSDLLLFVKVSREEAHFVYLGDHRSFDGAELPAAIAAELAGDRWRILGVLPPREDGFSASERTRLRRSGLMLPELVDGQMIAMPPLASDGSSVFHVHHASKIARWIKYWEPRLDTASGVEEFAAASGLRTAEFSRTRWCFYYGDFCLQTAQRKSVLCVPWRR